MAYESNTELVVLSKAGDKDAFGRLVERHWEKLLRLVERIVGDYHLAQDLVQDTFVRAHQSLHRLDRPAMFLCWVRRIARNVAVDRMRRDQKRRMQQLREPDHVPCGEMVYEAPPAASSGGRQERVLASRVWRAVTGMPERDRTLMVLHYGRGMTQQQIATECGISQGVVKVTLHRGRNRLSDLMRKCDSA